MNLSIKENLGSIDRSVRMIVGIALCVSILFMSYSAEWIAAIVLVAMYPLFSALIAFDPVLMLMEKTKLKPVFYKRMHPTAA